MALIQTITANVGNNATQISLTFPQKVAAGNLIILEIAGDQGVSVTGVTDDVGNTYTNRISTTLSLATNTQFYYYDVVGSKAGAKVITATLSGSGPFSGHANAIAREHNGPLTSGALDISPVGASGTNSSPNSGASGTTASASELVIGLVVTAVASDTFTAGSGYGNEVTQGGGVSCIAMEDKIITSAGAQTATFTAGSSTIWECYVLTYKTNFLLYLPKPVEKLQSVNRAATF